MAVPRQCPRCALRSRVPMTTEENDDDDLASVLVCDRAQREACSSPDARIPLLRSWSARSAEAREVLVRFQRAGRYGSIAKQDCTWFLPRQNVGSNPTRPTRESPDAASLPTVIRKAGAGTSTTKPVVRGDRSVRHTNRDGFNSHDRLQIAPVAQRQCPGPVNRVVEVRLFSGAPSVISSDATSSTTRLSSARRWMSAR
jgi:hypothetical protein